MPLMEAGRPSSELAHLDLERYAKPSGEGKGQQASGDGSFLAMIESGLVPEHAPFRWRQVATKFWGPAHQKPIPNAVATRRQAAGHGFRSPPTWV
jgi:hypothetical protein